MFFILASILAPKIHADSIASIKVGVANTDVVSMSGGESLNYDSSTGLLRFRDGYTDFNNFDILTAGDRSGWLARDYSLFQITLVGERSGKTFTVKSKFLSSKVGITNPHERIWTNSYHNNGCEKLMPKINPFVFESFYEIHAFNDIDSQCQGATAVVAYSNSIPVFTQGVYREVLFDIGSIINSEAYRSLPFDNYSGTAVYTGEFWKAWVGGIYRPSQRFDLTLEKKSYFSGIIVSNSKVPFSVKNIHDSNGFSVLGNASVNFNLLGSFSDDDRIKIDSFSANNYRLRSAGGSEIPYSVTLEYRGTRSPLVLQGNKLQSVILEPGMFGSTVNGQLKFNFNTPANLIHNGLFTDNLTLTAELVL